MRLSTIAELPPEFVAFLGDQGIKTDSDFLSLAATDILPKLSATATTLGSIKNYKNIVARASSATGVSAKILLESSPIITIPQVTSQLCLSLTPVMPALASHTGRIVEVSGYANSKKSEFILNIVLCYLMSNSSKAAYWVDTSGGFSMDRASDISSLLSNDDDHDCLERLRWSLALEVEQLYDILDEVDASAEQNPAGIGYLVVDKITSLFGPLLTASSSHGHAWMTEMMLRLKTIAQSHSITIFVMNDSVSRLPQLDVQSFSKSPALGPTFTFLTDATVWISIDTEHQPPHNSDSQLNNCTAHRLDVLKANFMAADVSVFFILQSGLHLVPGT